MGHSERPSCVPRVGLWWWPSDEEELWLLWEHVDGRRRVHRVGDTAIELSVPWVGRELRLEQASRCRVRPRPTATAATATTATTATTAAIGSAGTADDPRSITRSATTRLHIDLYLRHKRWREQRLVHGCRRHRWQTLRLNAAVWLGLEVRYHIISQHWPLRRAGQHVKVLLRRGIRHHPHSGRRLRAGVRRAPLRGGHAHQWHPILLPHVRC